MAHRSIRPSELNPGTQVEEYEMMGESSSMVSSSDGIVLRVKTRNLEKKNETNK
jgi:hypothetical protein